MSLAAGRMLKQFRLVEPLGRGGMGEVWKAEDTILGRPVAIKVLPDELSTDAGRLARFRREAKLLAALSHPNIAAVHELDEEEGLRFLVMELVPGETLDRRLDRRALAVDEAVDLCRQIAEALEAAHERGILHRDLKPANLVVTPEGRVKVLDFGLAKLLPAGEGTEAPAGEDSLETRTGTFLGTASHMSPEQARGRAVDRRTDIWAFGCVLYECLTGRSAFGRGTVPDTMAAILKEEPDWARLPADATPRLRDLLGRCLRRDPRRRLRDIGDARIALEECLLPESGSGVDAVVPSPWRAVLPWVVALLALAALASWIASREAGEAAPLPARLSVTLPSGERLVEGASPPLVLTADGRRLVYLASDGTTDRLWLRRLDRFDSTPIPGTEGASAPFLSPDGDWVGFFAAGRLRRAPLDGGGAVDVCALSRSPVGAGATWADGEIVFAEDYFSPLLRVPEEGGDPRALTELGEDEQGHGWPDAIGGGRRILFVARSSAGPRLEVVSLDGGERRRIEWTGGALGVIAATDEMLLWERGSWLIASRFDPRDLRLRGSSSPIVEDVLSSPASTLPYVAISVAGTMAYLPGGSAGRLAWSDREGRLEMLDAPPGDYRWPRLSPDGRHLAVAIASDGRWDIWVLDLERGTRQRLTSEGMNILPVWSPDGRRVAFASNRGGGDDLYDVPAGGGSAPERLLAREGPQLPLAWSADGDLLVFQESGPGQGADLLGLHPGGETSPLVSSPFNDGAAAFSPDGRLLAYVSEESGRTEVYVRSLEDGARTVVSADGGTEPAWSRDGDELFFRAGDRMMHARLQGRAPLELSRAEPLFRGEFVATPGSPRNYDVGSDGRFLIVHREPGTAEIRVVQGFLAEIEARLSRR